MPVTVIVGGQFGSEGKGKVALAIARKSLADVTVVRVGGTNSGHTGFDKYGLRYVLRQMPAACIDGDVDVVFPAGSYIDPEMLLQEIELLNFPKDRVFISPEASVIRGCHSDFEKSAGLVKDIGSTGSGVGACLIARALRGSKDVLPHFQAKDNKNLAPFLCDTTARLRGKLALQQKVIIEGTQGFGLSVDGEHWPKVTARSTTAAAAVAEAGLSPLDVKAIILVIRAYPIRVAGDSGSLPYETTWENIGVAPEHTSATNKLRRVGCFDAALVKKAIAANAPTGIVLNHVDYMKEALVKKFVREVEDGIGRKVTWLGFSEKSITPNFKTWENTDE